MKKLFTLILTMAFFVSFAQVEGTWKLSAQAAALGVGPELGNISWWSNSEADLVTRACFFDDQYKFHADGTFENVLQNETWVEEWQGMDPPGCATPVAPHDGSNAATWVYDAGAGTITLNGVGAYLGLAKVYNEGELSNPADAPASITYPVTFNTTGDTMEINISIGGGYWRYIIAKVNENPLVGKWKLSPQAAAIGVGPELGNISWWSNSAADVETRACYFDDEFVFHADGTFENVLQDQTWIEPWQGMDPEACGAPVYPHDGSNAATWTFDEGAGTITLNGVGAYLGLAKVFNEGELTNPADAPASITYPATFNATGDTMEINISIGTGYWRYILTTNAGGPPPPADALTLPITFNDEDLDYNIVDFGGNWSSIIVDPMDPSNRVLETFRDGEAQVWAGTTIGEPKGVEPAIPFSEGNTTMTIRVYSPEAGIPVLFKLEVWDNTSISVETIANTTVANEWETLSFDFSNEVEGTAPIDFANPYNKPVVFFNYGTPGSEAGEMTFLWDDIEFVDASFIDDNKYQVLNVYPNPVNEVLNIKNANDLSVVRIYSITGKLMVETTEVTSSIDVSSYPAGMYTISATDGNDNNYNAKFVVK